MLILKIFGAFFVVGDILTKMATHSIGYDFSKDE